jgi:hypothetical protein
MDIKEAVKLARDHVASVFSDDGGTDFALEEVDFDHGKSEWLITISFKRVSALDAPSVLSQFQPRGLPGLYPRFQKVVRINSRTAEVLSVKNREPDMAA